MYIYIYVSSIGDLIKGDIRRLLDYSSHAQRNFHGVPLLGGPHVEAFS